jgi:hypothetical protein
LLDKKVGTFTRALHGRGEEEWLDSHQHEERLEEAFCIRAMKDIQQEETGRTEKIDLKAPFFLVNTVCTHCLKRHQH